MRRSDLARWYRRHRRLAVFTIAFLALSMALGLNWSRWMLPSLGAQEMLELIDSETTSVRRYLIEAFDENGGFPLESDLPDGLLHTSYGAMTYYHSNLEGAWSCTLVIGDYGRDGCIVYWRYWPRRGNPSWCVDH